MADDWSDSVTFTIIAMYGNFILYFSWGVTYREIEHTIS